MHACVSGMCHVLGVMYVNTRGTRSKGSIENRNGEAQCGETMGHGGSI